MNYEVNNSTVNGHSFSMSGSKVVINGVTIEAPKGNLNIINGKIFVDGKEIDTSNTDLKGGHGVVNVTIHGDVDTVDCNGNVDVKGNVKKYIDCNGSVSVTGNVDGKIDCGGSVRINGDHKGSIDAGGSVSIR